MNKSKVISAMLMTTLLFGVSLLRADDKQKQQQAAKQAQQQQLKKDVAAYNAKYKNQPVQAGSAQAAQQQRERQALEQRKKNAQKQ